MATVDDQNNTGTPEDDNITGTVGDDKLAGERGNDTTDGAGGYNIVRCDGAEYDYIVKCVADGSVGVQALAVIEPCMNCSINALGISGSDRSGDLRARLCS